jgi:hypothetical protein
MSEDGFYWVQFYGDWMIAEWDSKDETWSIAGLEHDYRDGQFHEIDERRITRGEVVPDGWKLVPIEPTRPMYDAAFDCWIDCYNGDCGCVMPVGATYASEIYQAMLDAAPNPGSDAVE